MWTLQAYLTERTLATIELTAKGIDALPIPSEEARLADYSDARVSGLSLRVFASGRRSWYVRYRANGKRRRYKLGDYPTLGLSEARKRAEKTRVEVRDGSDPVADREGRQGADSLGDLIERYLEEHATKNLAPRTQVEAARILLGNDLAGLRGLPATNVTDADVAKALDRIERRGAMTMCNRTQTALSAVYTWAAPRRRAGVVSNPVKGLPRRHHERGTEKRHLSPDEIRTVFGAVDDIPGVPVWAGAALWLILATGQRPGEVLRAEWAHMTVPTPDGHGRRLWKMPRGYRKRVRGQREAPAHDVPLSNLAVDVIQRLPQARSRFLFPSTGKARHKSTVALNQRITRGLLKNVSVEHFTPHDLRRTCATQLHGMGQPRHVVEKILGHSDTTVAGIYDRHDYWEERQEALDAWGERLREIISG